MIDIVMIDIVPIATEHIPGYRASLGEVARERRHILLLDAPPLEAVERFVGDNIGRGLPQFVALDGARVVGWCDIIPHRRPGLTHAGVLGMGVIASHRGRGIGTRLLAATLERASALGLVRIELEVYAANRAALALYRRFGFVREGVRRRARYLDGVWDDIVLMALLTDEPSDEAAVS